LPEASHLCVPPRKDGMARRTARALLVLCHCSGLPPGAAAGGRLASVFVDAHGEIHDAAARSHDAPAGPPLVRGEMFAADQPAMTHLASVGEASKSSTAPAGPPMARSEPLAADQPAVTNLVPVADSSNSSSTPAGRPIARSETLAAASAAVTHLASEAEASNSGDAPAGRSTVRSEMLAADSAALTNLASAAPSSNVDKNSGVNSLALKLTGAGVVFSGLFLFPLCLSLCSSRTQERAIPQARPSSAGHSQQDAGGSQNLPAGDL